MSKLTIKEAVECSGMSESTLRRDIKSGKVSSEKDTRGRRLIQIAEVSRVYGHPNGTHSPDTAPDNKMTAPDTPETLKIVALLENQVQDLKAQLEKADAHLKIATAEKTKLLDILAAEKEEKRLMLPPPQRKKSKHRWLGYFRLKK